jgi:hypothetical protein
MEDKYQNLSLDSFNRKEVIWFNEKESEYDIKEDGK